MDFSIFSNLKVAKPETTRVKQPVTFTGGDFIVTKAGAILFSEEFVKRLTVDTDKLRFLDLVDGRLMKFTDGVKVPFLFVGILDYGAKVASIQGYEGKMAFVKNKLVPLLADLYQIDWEKTPRVEFKLLKENKIEGYNGIHYLPRVNKKGVMKYVRRENIDLFPCVPVSMITQETEFTVE